MPTFIDLTGKQFGEWTVIGRGPDTTRGTPRWQCQCNCGGIFLCDGSNLRGGVSTRCKACSNRSKAAKNASHGMSNTPIFVAWFGMVQRCNNPKHRSFSYYGGRGITVCERWRTFENFYADMGDRPPGHSLERKDNSGPYCKENCEWATREKQMRNTRSNTLITFRDETRTQAEWAEIVGISQRTISDRLLHGWDVETALTRRPGLGKRKRR